MTAATDVDPSKSYTRVLVCVAEGRFAVVGYRQGTFYPHGNFATVGEAVELALTLPTKSHRHPVNILRGGLLE